MNNKRKKKITFDEELYDMWAERFLEFKIWKKGDFESLLNENKIPFKKNDSIITLQKKAKKLSGVAILKFALEISTNKEIVELANDFRNDMGMQDVLFNYLLQFSRDAILYWHSDYCMCHLLKFYNLKCDYRCVDLLRDDRWEHHMALFYGKHQWNGKMDEDFPTLVKRVEAIDTGEIIYHVISECTEYTDLAERAIYEGIDEFFYVMVHYYDFFDALKELDLPDTFIDEVKSKKISFKEFKETVFKKIIRENVLPISNDKNLDSVMKDEKENKSLKTFVEKKELLMKFAEQILDPEPE